MGQVGLAFCPEWTGSVVIVSEVTTRLPVWAMHQYASAILDALQPTKYVVLILFARCDLIDSRCMTARTSLLDSYPVPSYITAEPVPYHEAPIRYLATPTPTPELVRALNTTHIHR